MVELNQFISYISKLTEYSGIFNRKLNFVPRPAKKNEDIFKRQNLPASEGGGGHIRDIAKVRTRQVPGKASIDY